MNTTQSIKSLALAVPLAFASCGDNGGSQAAAETGPAPYPLDTCIVSGEALDSMGDPVVIVHEGREIKFCCDKCVPKFRENPDKYLAKLQGDGAGSDPMEHSDHNH